MSEDTINCELLSGTHRQDGETYWPGDVVELRRSVYETFDHSFEPASDTSDTSTSDDTDNSDGAFDAQAFVDRTPMKDVLKDIRTDDYNDHLDAIEAAEREREETRSGVIEAIASRRDN